MEKEAGRSSRTGSGCKATTAGGNRSRKQPERAEAPGGCTVTEEAGERAQGGNIGGKAVAVFSC